MHISSLPADPFLLQLLLPPPDLMIHVVTTCTQLARWHEHIFGEHMFGKRCIGGTLLLLVAELGSGRQSRIDDSSTTPVANDEEEEEEVIAPESGD